MWQQLFAGQTPNHFSNPPLHSDASIWSTILLWNQVPTKQVFDIAAASIVERHSHNIQSTLTDLVHFLSNLSRKGPRKHSLEQTSYSIHYIVQDWQPIPRSVSLVCRDACTYRGVGHVVRNGVVQPEVGKLEAIQDQWARNRFAGSWD